MKTEIAIIGISLKVFNTENLEQFWNFVTKNENGFCNLSTIRQQDIFKRFGKFQIAKGCYLDRVDLFDNDFFGILPIEAERMDPEQRLMMEGVVKAVYNAGYTIKELKGQRIGIFHVFNSSKYRDFFDESNIYSTNAHHPGMGATRVANFMDWRGPLVGFNTSCSTSFTALYYACQSLATGDCSLALVGGANLGVIKNILKESSDVDPTIENDVLGEGVFFFLLKKAEDAIKDSDPVHAIIKGGAVNNGGALLQQISVPSPAAQTEVINMAWKNSKVDIGDIQFIETKGTGTKIGDQIEYLALLNALKTNRDATEGKTCPVSSVNGQIGHLGFVSGLAGLTRLVLAINNKKLLPQIGTLPDIENHGSNFSVSVQKQAVYWDSEGPRTAGITSYGRTGMNVHFVIGEAVPTKIQETKKGVKHFIKIGGYTEKVAMSVKEYLLKYLNEHRNVSLDELCYSVIKISEFDIYAKVIIFNDRVELENQLNKLDFVKRREKFRDHEFLLLISGIIKPENIALFLANRKTTFYSYLDQIEVKNLDLGKMNHDQRNFIYHYSALKSLQKAGFAPDKILAAQRGKLLTDLLSGISNLEEALLQLSPFNNEIVYNFNESSFIKFLNSLDPNKKYDIVMMGEAGEMNISFRKWIEKSKHENIAYTIPAAGTDIYAEIIKKYYNSGNDLRLIDLTTKRNFLHDLDLPIFDNKRFWPE